MENKCSNCKQRMPKDFCGESESIYYKQKVECTNSCDHFERNPASEHFTNGLVLAVKGDNPLEAVKELEAAIKLGLSHEDEMEARFCLGGQYAELVNWDLPEKQMIDTHEFREFVEQREKAVLMDAEKNYGFFADPINRSSLSRLDSAYTIVSGVLSQNSKDSAKDFLIKKIELFEYLPTNPMLTMLLELGVFYAEESEAEKAKTCFEKILTADAVIMDSERKEFEVELRRKAANNIEMLENTGTEKASPQRKTDHPQQAVSLKGPIIVLLIGAFMLLSGKNGIVGALVMFAIGGLWLRARLKNANKQK